MVRFVLFIIVGVLPIIQAIDYCQYGQNHVACDWHRKPRNKCNVSNNGGLVRWSSKDRQLIEDLHNHYRNQVAGRKVKNFPGAHRMLKMKYDKELEYLAILNVRKCIIRHDANFVTARFRYPGQNWAAMFNSAAHIGKKNGIKGSIKMWFDEYRYAALIPNQQNHVCFKNTNMNKQIGHFTEIMRDKAKRVGCAAMKYYKWPYYTFYMVCNYSYGNMNREEVYEAKKRGKSVGQGCKKGRDYRFKNLCNAQEEVRPIPAKGVKTVTYLNNHNQEFRSLREAQRSPSGYITRTTITPVQQCPAT